jgi:uncharacterized membrane protein
MMKRQFDWLLAGAWTVVAGVMILTLIGIVLLVGWLA